jgi:hypothetical protein
MTCGLRSLSWNWFLAAYVLLIGVLLYAAPAHSAPAGAPTFSIGNVTVPETTAMGSSAVVTVVKSGPAKSYSKVEIRTSNGTAIAGVDYGATDVTLTFANNELTKQVSVPILNDNVAEPSETFAVGCIAVRFARCGAPAVVTITDDDAAAPPPAPTSTGLPGEAEVKDNFEDGPGLVTAEGAPYPVSLSDGAGAWRIFCTSGPISKVDPLVLPGQVGVSHAHQFIGNTGVTENSNYQSLRTSGGTTCGTDQAHPYYRSAIWFPAMKVTVDGVDYYKKPDFTSLYYKRNSKTKDPVCHLVNTPHLGECVDLPNGIRFVVGYDMKTGASWVPGTIRFSCWGSEDGKVSGGTAAAATYNNLAEFNAAKCPIGAQLVIAANSPSCWNSLSLDPGDHRSHMAYATGAWWPNELFPACPEDHHFPIPNVELLIHYTVTADMVTARFSSDEMVAGAVPGSTFHFDYWEAQSPFTKAKMHQCLDGPFSASSGAFCEGGSTAVGTQIEGGDVPWGGFPVPPLVPLSSIP